MSSVKYFYIRFRNTISGDRVTLNMRPEKHCLSELWQEMMLKNFIKPDAKPLNKNFCFHAWQTSWDQPSYSRNLKVLCEMLNHSISEVNRFYTPIGYPIIECYFTLDVLSNENTYRSNMNDLHHHFETLIGQVEKTSEWYFKPGSQEACYHVQQLNSLLHEIEATVNKLVNNNGESVVMINYSGPYWNGDYNPESERYKLKNEHLECFENIQHQWGMVTANYSQLGKQYIEVFLDGDDVIGEENISNIKYMLGECIVNFGNTPPNSKPKPFLRDEFVAWLKKNQIDPYDKTLGFGLGVLARTYPEDNLHIADNWQDIDVEIKKCDDIDSVGFVYSDGYAVSKSYDYTWQDYREANINNTKGLSINV